MNYIGKEDETVKRTYTKRDEDYIGLYIQTNYDTYKFCIEKFQSCCEFYGVTLFDNDIKTLNIEGKPDCYCPLYSCKCKPLPLEEKDYELLQYYFLKKIEYCHERSIGSKYDEGVKACSVKITLKGNSPEDLMYYIDIWNDHGGYYPHSYLIEWNNFKNKGSL